MQPILNFLNKHKRATTVVAFCFGVGFFIFVDQWIKFYIFSHPTINLKIVINHKVIIALTHFYNSNFAFSLPVPIKIIYIIYFIILFIIFTYLFKKFNNISHMELFGWGLILAGAFSNIGERLLHGAVKDFIYLVGGGIINFADLFILSGLIIVMFFSHSTKSLE